MITYVLKRVRTHAYGLSAFAIIACAVALRVILAANHWPPTDSDEGTMGLEAMHIAFRGEHPIFLYGQNYMGIIEAYLGALLFRLFGVSLLTLRLGMIILFALFLISVYLLASLLYTKRLALVTLALLSAGATNIILPELRSVGGAEETLLFGTLSLLLATWLALTTTARYKDREAIEGRAMARQGRAMASIAPTLSRRRLLAYFAWGLVVGLGLWSHLLVAPFVLAGGLILLVFCWREWRSRAIPCILLGIAIGGFPLIYYNLTVPFSQNSLNVALTIQSASNTGIPASTAPLIKRVAGTFLYSLPIATGFSPACNLQALPLFGAGSPDSLACSLVQGGWSLGYMALLAIALLVPCLSLWRLWRSRKIGTLNADTTALPEMHGDAVISFARLMLACCALLTILLYVNSPLSAEKPWSTRYLIGLLIALPAILWPLWHGLSSRAPATRPARFWIAVGYAIIMLTGFIYLAGTIGIAQSVPPAQALYQNDERLIHDLEQRGITRFYTDYWTCDRLVFISQEHLICSVVSINFGPGLNRYVPYTGIVAALPNAPYVFPPGSFADAAARDPAFASYHIFYIDGWVVYQPD